MLTEGLIYFVAEDMRPLAAVEDPGFMMFSHTLVNIQNKYATPIDNQKIYLEEKQLGVESKEEHLA